MESPNPFPENEKNLGYGTKATEQWRKGKDKKKKKDQCTLHPLRCMHHYGNKGIRSPSLNHIIGNELYMSQGIQTI